MNYTPNLQRRQAPKWLIVLLPFTLPVALLRFVLRSFARSALLLPRECQRGRLFAQLLLWVTVTAIRCARMRQNSAQRE